MHPAAAGRATAATSASGVAAVRAVRRRAHGTLHEQQRKGVRDVDVCAYEQVRERLGVGGQSVLCTLVLREWQRVRRRRLLPLPVAAGVATWSAAAARATCVATSPAGGSAAGRGVRDGALCGRSRRLRLE